MTRSARQRRIEVPLLVTLALVLVAMILFDRPLVVGDGLAYLFWLDSIALDGDLDLSNQAEKFAHVNTYHIYRNDQSGHWASAFPLGAAILLAPFYKAASWLDTLPQFRINDEHFWGIQGAFFAYGLLIMIGVNLYALLMVSMGYGIARRFVGPWPSALVALAVYLGTPLLFYTTVEPLNSHSAGAFAATWFVWLWLRARERQSGFHWTLTGLVAGLAALCRWQVVLIALPVGIELLLRRRARRQRWREIALYVLGLTMLVWIIPYSWQQMFGSPLLIPAAARGGGEFLLRPIHTRRVLFDPIAGLFPWSPVTLLALFGILPLLKNDWKLALVGAAMFLLQALVSGSVRDWWAGTGFGMRRMSELYPLYVLLLAALVGAASQYRWLRLGLLSLSSVLALYGAALVLARLSFTWTNPWGLARDRPFTELRYAFSRENWRLLWPVIREHVGPWAWARPGP